MSLSREPRQKWNSRDQLVQKTPKRSGPQTGYQGGGHESRVTIHAFHGNTAQNN